MKILQILLSAVFNRCRGNNWFKLVTYDTISRLLYCFAITVTNFSTSPIWLIILIAIGMLHWCVYAWDEYWGFAGGQPTTLKPVFLPADYILSKLPIKPGSRIFGVVGMGLRQGICAIPLFLILGYFVNLQYLYLIPVPFLFGIPYWAFSYRYTQNFVAVSEFLIGAIWGVIL